MASCSDRDPRIGNGTALFPRHRFGAASISLVRRVLTATLLALLVVVAGCSTGQVRKVNPKSAAMQGFKAADDLYVVDCLLPGEVRQMGNMTYLSPRVHIKTTAENCKIRGGEYVLYSRANYQSALRVWMGQAKGGNAQAQVIVGEIYARGLGTKPDYKKAAYWYRKAALQGNKSAQQRLGYLYEEGLGVKKDLMTALQWYRKSTGDKDKLILASAAQQKIDALRKQLQAQLKTAQAQVRALQSQVKVLKQQQRQGSRNANAQQQGKTIHALQQLLTQTKGRLDEKSTRLAQLNKAKFHSTSITRGGNAMGPAEWKGVNFGHYYALIIALQKYRYWNDLATPKADAKSIAKILSTKYGFHTRTIVNADTYDILAALNDLREKVGKNDNVLIYFAGHGQIRKPLQGKDTGYWLPVNAQKQRTTFWLPNSQINQQLSMLKARSVLVIADSCYAGALSTDPASILLGGHLKLTPSLIKLAVQRRARYVLSSGGLHPVLDRGSGNHSVFAAALIHLLKTNDKVLTGRGILQGVKARVARRSAALGFEEKPELRPIRAAGDDPGGRFFLVPRTIQ